MKDIKITKDNYKELFECAGFEKESNFEYRMIINGFCLSLWWVNNSLQAFCSTDFFGVHDQELKVSSNSTAELDRIFYPFLDNPPSLAEEMGL